MHLVQVGLLVRGDPEAVLEEGCVNNDYEEDDGRQSLVESVCDGLFGVASGGIRTKTGKKWTRGQSKKTHEKQFDIRRRRSPQDPMNPEYWRVGPDRPRGS